MVVLVAVGTKLWYSGALKATGSSDAAIIVKEGETSEEIAASLKQKNLIKSERAFGWHAKLKGYGPKFKSGRYILSGKKTTAELAKTLTESQAAAHQFTIVEGLTQRQIGERLESLEIAKSKDFSGLKVRDFAKYDYLAELPADTSLEGFLFPETYELPPADSDVKAVADIMLTQFGKELTDELRAQIRQSGRSLYETIIIASIVEKEVRSEQDRKLVAGVLYARMERGMRLDADATTRYGLNKLTGALTQDDLGSDNPYNTRKVKGLPPGPISNPGISSIEAAISPDASEFLYYLSAPDGKTIFAVTLEEHEANVQKFLR